VASWPRLPVQVDDDQPGVSVGPDGESKRESRRRRALEIERRRRYRAVFLESPYGPWVLRHLAEDLGYFRTEGARAVSGDDEITSRELIESNIIRRVLFYIGVFNEKRKQQWVDMVRDLAMDESDLQEDDEDAGTI